MTPLPANAASDTLVLALLARCLMHQHAELSALFPSPHTEWTYSFALGIAAQLQDVRRQLAEGDRSPADLLSLVPDEEKDRWRDIARLEQQLLHEIQELGLEDPLIAGRTSARHPPTPLPCSRVVSLFIPDLSALAVRTLQSLSAQSAVEIHILAPESEADRFDAWGRPLPEHWETEPLPFAENQIHVFEQTPDETETVSTLLKEADQQDRALSLCIPDPEHARALARRLQIDGRPLYLPNGVALSATAPGRLCAAWLTLLRQPTYAATAAFLRHPDAQDWLTLRLNLNSTDELLSELDQCQARHLPATFDDLFHFARQGEKFTVLARALAEIQKYFSTPLPLFLADLYDCRKPASSDPSDPLFAEAARSLATLVQSTDETARRLALRPEDALDLLQTALPSEQVFPRPNPGAPHEALGWLEVQWETAPAILLADMREGIVPESHLGDAFLPDALRSRAGLAGNRDAFARDLFLARSLLSSSPSGGVRFLYSRRSSSQDPQLPSRLLLACPNDELSARIDLLFNRPALCPLHPAAPARPALRISPPPCSPDQIPTSISVTAFKAYIACPFRFYLSHVLRMQAEDDSARELDPMGFGNLAHDTLRILAKHPAFDDEKALQGLLLAELDRLAKAQFGSRPPLAVQVQLESLRQRLRAAGTVHAVSVREGWRIIAAEEKYEAELVSADDSARMLLRARIDRIDRHLDSGQIRILDYKTTNAGTPPTKTHYRPGVGEWVDLQLPLYRYLYEQLHPRTPLIEVGYFTLPKAAAETQIEMLDFQSRSGEDLYPSAIETARNVIARIRAGEFWPPQPVPAAYDDYAFLFASDPKLIREAPAP